MPGKHANSLTDESCRRCKENSSVLVVRKEPLCRDCFVKYVNTKTIKRLESFRVRYSNPNQQRKILLPISFGVSSVTLLHIVDTHLKNQKAKTGRTGFALTVLFVDASTVAHTSPHPGLLSRMRERYPEHQYATVPLQDVFRVVPAQDPLFDLIPDSNTDQEAPVLEQLSKLLSSLTSATAHADVTPTLRTRLIVEEAKRLGCEAILWGDTTTRLAEKTLSETAKGRGFSLPWQISDGESPYGITFNYPLRDVLRKELIAYTDLSESSLGQLIDESSGSIQSSKSSKNTTIDDLMKQYFESVEENFPSIVANVVRTSSRLEAKTAPSSDPRCSLCRMPVTDGRFGIHGWGGDQQDMLEDSPKGNGQGGLCYGCTRSIPRAASHMNGFT